MLSWCWQKLYRLARDRRGVAYIEFALTLPFLMLFTAGIIDLTRMLLLHQKVDKAVFTLNDILTQQEIQTGACDQIDGLSQTVVRDTLRPFQYDPANFQLIVTSVLGTGPAGNPNGPLANRVEWTWTNGGRAQHNYTFAIPNDQAFPLDLAQNERMIRVEMFYRFFPLLPDFSGLTSGTFVKRSFMVPRATVGANAQNYWLYLGPPSYVTGGALSNCS